MEKLTNYEKKFGKYADRPNVKKRISDTKKEMKEIDKELGRCTYCHCDNINSKYVLCASCRLKQRKWRLNRTKNK